MIHTPTVPKPPDAWLVVNQFGKVIGAFPACDDPELLAMVREKNDSGWPVSVVLDDPSLNVSHYGIMISNPSWLTAIDIWFERYQSVLESHLRDPRVALLFLIPGSGSTLRVNGRAYLSAEPELLASFRMDGKAPRTVIVMTVEEIYFQCARAIVRADLWNPDKRVDPKSLPTPGTILAEMSENTVGGEKYDREWPERARQTMW